MTTGTMIRATDQPLATWRGGTTRAIYADPSETLGAMAQAHLWAGTAVIERDGPYSVFDNRTRIHLPVRGNGLRLHFQEPTETTPLETFSQATFAGDRPLDVTLVDGPVEAFNLIFHPTVEAEVEVLHLASTAAAISLQCTVPLVSASRMAVQIVYLVDGLCAVAQPGVEPLLLSPGDGYVCGVEEAVWLRGADTDARLIRALCVL